MQWVLDNKTVVLPTLTQLIGNPSETRAWPAVILDVGALLVLYTSGGIGGEGAYSSAE
jgi:hypothetical protein